MSNQRSEAQQVEALKEIADVVLEAVQVAGVQGVPSGHLYAMLMPYGIRIDIYNLIIAALKRAGRITEEHHVLRAVQQPAKKEN